MKKILVLGITGGFGGHVAQAFARQGFAIKAMMRNPTTLPEQFRGIETVQGDAANVEDIRSAAQDVDLLVYGINPANYQWDGKAFPWLDNTASVAEELGLNIVFPGNVYVFNPNDGPTFDENAAAQPVSSLGKIRIAMEERLKQASQNGARVIIVRAGDFIGADAHSTWVRQLIKPSKNGYTVSAAGPVDLPHSWAYLPDVARAVVELAMQMPQLPAYNVFHFKGYQCSFAEIAEAIRQSTGKAVKIKAFPWWLFRTLSPFSSLFRGLLEMRYLWQKPVNLRDAKLRSTLNNPLLFKSLGEALIESGITSRT